MNSDSTVPDVSPMEFGMVPTWKRIVAFTMDMILLLVLLQLLGEILPNAPDQVKNEFDQLIINARHLSQQNESYLKQTTEFIGNSQFSPETCKC